MGWFPQQAGGLNRMFYNLVHHLPDHGVSVRGLVTGASVPQNGVSVNAFAATDAPLPGRLYRARTAARAALDNADPDLVASHFALYTLPWLDLIGDRPFVMHFHGPWALEGRVEQSPGMATHLKKRIESAVYRRADRFIVLSAAFRDVLHQTYDVPINRIEIIPGGVDVDHFALPLTPREAREQLDWPTDRPIVFCVRRLARRMGLENLVDAMAFVRQAVPDALLMIAGSGPLAAELQQRIDDQDLTSHVRLLGFLPDAHLPPAYRAAEVSIVPTTALEGFGLITIESLAAGTPVLVTPVGGLPETVTGLDENLVLGGTETEDLTRALTDVLQSPSSLPSAPECEAYARDNFDWPKIAARTRDLYLTVFSHA